MPKIVSININKNGGVPKHPVAFAYVDNLNVIITTDKWSEYMGSLGLSSK